MFTVEFKNNDNYGEIEFPCDENYLFSKLNELRAEDMLNPQLTAVKIDVDELKFVEGKQTNVDELNFLAKYLESLIDREVDTFLAIVQAEHISTLKSAINAAFNQGNYTLIQNISNMEQIGKTHFMAVNQGMTEEEKTQTDFEKIGRDLMNSGKGIVTGKGVLFEHENAEQQEFYNGKTFPLYLYENCMYVADAEYEGKHEYLYLPAIPVAIHKALNRLGAKSPEECSITIYDESGKGTDWLETIVRIADEESIDTANRIAARINKMSAKTRFKLKAVMDFADRKDGESIIRLADNLGSFSFYPNVSDKEELGRAMIEENDEYFIHEDIADFFMFEQYAESIMSESDTQFTENGVVILNGKTLSEILEETQEHSMDLSL